MLVAYCNLLGVSHQGIKTKIYQYWIFQKIRGLGQKVLKQLRRSVRRSVGWSDILNFFFYLE